MTMRNDAERLLHAALRILETHGRADDGRPEGKPLVLRAMVGDLELRARAQYRRWPRAADAGIEGGPERNPGPKHPPVYGLDIRRGTRIFSVGWDGGFPITVLRFKRGEWEREIEAADRALGETRD